MLNQREFIIAILKFLKEAVEDKILTGRNRALKGVVVYTKPTPLAHGGYVSMYAIRQLDDGSGNGGIMVMTTEGEIEDSLRGDRRSLVDLYQVSGKEIFTKIEDYYSNGTRGRGLDFNTLGRSGSNILPLVGTIVDELEETFSIFLNKLAEELPDVDAIDFMNSSVILPPDVVTELDGYKKVGNTFQSPSGIYLKLRGFADNGEALTAIGLSNDLKRATKNDLM